jgi:hypothetical protein
LNEAAHAAERRRHEPDLVTASKAAEIGPGAECKLQVRIGQADATAAEANQERSIVAIGDKQRALVDDAPAPDAIALQANAVGLGKRRSRRREYACRKREHGDRDDLTFHGPSPRF